MEGVGVAEETGYVSLKDFRVVLGKRCGDFVAEEADGCFALCFWLYIDKCASYPSPILNQKHPGIDDGAPFLWLDEEKKLKLSPVLLLHEEAWGLSMSMLRMTAPCASSPIEFPVKKWVYVGCEVLPNYVRLHVDGSIVGEKPLSCSNKSACADIMGKLSLACPYETEENLHGYIHGHDVLFQSPDIQHHYTKDPPVHLSIDDLNASEIEEDSDGVWSIVGGKASCRRIFSMDITLMDALGCPVNRELEVVASLVYADNEVTVEDTADAEPPLLMSYDGIEYACRDRPCKLINGRASFKLKISQLSSKCDNRLFQIMFHIPQMGRYPFFKALSLPIRCISRSKTSRTVALTSRKSSNRNHYINRCESSSLDDGSMELVPNIIREAKPSPSSKRIKLGNDVPLAMFKEELKQANKGHGSIALSSNGDDAHEMSMNQRPDDQYMAENNSSSSDNGDTTNCGLKSIPSPISDLIIFKYCLGSLAERFHLLKEIAITASEEQLENFAKQVSLFSGCLHHWHQIRMAKRLVEEGIQVWTSLPKNDDHHVPWENLVLEINDQFMKIAGCTRALTIQDFECLRRIAGCRNNLVSQEDFERIWSWLYPVAFTLSLATVKSMWSCTFPVWMEGFITKEEAETALQNSGGLQDPGTFVLRFPTSRSWPHPDAGNLVVTYIGSDYTIHNRLLSLDFIISSSSCKMTSKLLQELLLEEPELSKLGRVVRNHL
ncbi:SH2 domain-containing protein A-like [Andrographis paniculata]|uniref:SH2 domain-containing protein A-like n=1 Tax=Andrographis paniculata TaxID=175694 RepID=UPI0021E7F99C|nr:SH2 domain-containing protein A-like [Andrographis paniculata]